MLDGLCRRICAATLDRAYLGRIAILRDCEINAKLQRLLLPASEHRSAAAVAIGS